MGWGGFNMREGVSFLCSFFFVSSFSCFLFLSVLCVVSFYVLSCSYISPLHFLPFFFLSPGLFVLFFFFPLLQGFGICRMGWCGVVSVGLLGCWFIDCVGFRLRVQEMFMFVLPPTTKYLPTLPVTCSMCAVNFETILYV